MDKNELYERIAEASKTIFFFLYGENADKGGGRGSGTGYRV